MEEVWRPVVGYEGLYEVSNTGLVRSLDRYDNRGCFRKGELIVSRDNGRGYRYIRLHKDGITYTKYVHRLVAQTFIPNYDNLSEVNHKDEDKTNNRVDNLEWCTRSYNVSYGSRKISNVLSSSVPVSQYDLNGNWIRDWNSGKDVIKSFGGRSLSSICNCLKGRSKTSFGYIWKYKNADE